MFEGEIRRVDHTREGVDRVTTIGLGGADKAKGREFVRSYGAPVTLATICRDAVEAMGLRPDERSLASLPGEIFSQWSWSGLARDALRELLTPRRYLWYELNRTVYFGSLDGSPAIRSDFIVSEANGLVGTAGVTEAGAKAKILLNASLTLDQYALFRSEAVNGRFIVDKLAHVGDTWGEAWWTEFEARVPGKDAVEEDPALSFFEELGLESG